MSGFNLSSIILAARMCREKSVSGKSIYILITDEGFVVRGDRGPLTATLDVPFLELDARPHLLEGAIEAVSTRLRD